MLHNGHYSGKFINQEIANKRRDSEPHIAMMSQSRNKDSVVPAVPILSLESEVASFAQQDTLQDWSLWPQGPHKWEWGWNV